MKFIAPALALMCLLSCSGSTTNRPTPIAVNSDDYRPPTDQEVSWNDKREPAPERTLREASDSEYQKSIDKINQTFLDEQLLLQMCSEVHQYSSECAELRNDYCQLDTMIDARGGKHHKPYCLNSQTSDNPY